MGVLRVVPEYIWSFGRNLQLKMSAEKSMATGIPSAIESRLFLTSSGSLRDGQDYDDSTMLQIRCEDTGLAYLSCALPLHPRLVYEGVFSKNIWGFQAPLSLPIETRGKEWWLPDLSLTAVGTVKACKQVWLSTRDNRLIPRIGVRFSVRRQFDWSLLSTSLSASPFDDGTTQFVVNIQGASPQWRVGAQFTSSLEAPIASARTILSTHWHSYSKLTDEN
jgi:hypothetical protein